MRTVYFFALYSLFAFSLNAQIVIKNSQTKNPVSYATISFGNGNGVFADDEGIFFFTKKLYPDIDTLYISAIGFEELKIAVSDLPKEILLNSQVNELDEILISTNINRKFKVEKRKPTTHDDYFKCWLPTIESEIAVFFPNKTSNTKKITKVFFPIKVEASDWKERKRKNSKKRVFSTLFKVQFYDNIDGLPGDPLNYAPITFIATEKNKSIFELNVEENSIYIPEGGVFISLQVLGYTDRVGKLLPNKKYKEIKTKTGIKKVPTNFRPLLPFTDQISEKQTYIKRVFINGGQWYRYEKKNEQEPSKLLNAGLNNYGIGIHTNIYKNE